MMFTDEQVIEAARARLGDELSDLTPGEHLLATVRRRHARRTAAARLAGGAAAAVAAAAVAVPLAVSAGGTAPGGPAPGGPGPASGRAGQTVRLAGYAITLPAGFRVRQSSPTQASGTLRGATVRFTLQVPAAPPPPGARKVTVGGLGTCWYLRTPAHQILDEISNTRWPDGRKRTALVITATGMSRPQLFQLVEHQAITAGTPVPAGG
jgi:hypothetical protein